LAGIGLKSYSTLLWLQKPQVSEQGAKGATIAPFCYGAKEHEQKTLLFKNAQEPGTSLRAENRRKNMVCASTVP
jgi:hypothetical protein